MYKICITTYLYVVVNAGLHIDSWIFYQACACIPDLTIYVYLELYRQTQTFLWCRKFICFFLPTKIHSRFLHTKVSFFWVSSQDRSSSGFQPKNRPLIGSDLSAQPIGGLFFCWETNWTHVLTWISEKLTLVLYATWHRKSYTTVVYIGNLYF